MIVSTYTEAARADGAWTCPVRLPATPFERVRAALSVLANDSGWPVAAFCYGAEGIPVTELLLYRDPSRTHGTPSVDECVAAVHALVDATGWTAEPEHAPTSGVVVGLGLREGYESGALTHLPAEVDQLLAEHAGWRCETAWLVSARRVDGAVRWYDEIGVVVRAPTELTPVIEQIATAFAQHRFVVTDLTARQTRAFAQ